MIITVPAAKVRQGALSFYATSFKVRDLMRENFYSITRLDPETGTGYQRVLQESRVNRLADYIIRGQETKDAFLPTSVFLATEKSITFDDKNNTISFDTEDIGEFNVVDGQHRLEGLKRAAKKDERVFDFEISVNIAYDLPYLHQMCHFLIVNTTQKSVDKGIEQRIISRLTASLKVENAPTMPQWIQRIVEKGDTAKALKLVEYLNETQDSPWQGKVLMANQIKRDYPNTTIKQDSFVKAINTYIMTANNPLIAMENTERECKMLLNYWKAITNLLKQPGDESPTVLYKYIGVTLFSMFSIPFFHKLNAVESYTVETMQEHLINCFDNIDAEYEYVRVSESWLSGKEGYIGGLNRGALVQVSAAMARALNSNREIKI